MIARSRVAVTLARALAATPWPSHASSQPSARGAEAPIHRAHRPIDRSADRPAPPALEVDIGPRSSDAAGRYYWLFERLDGELARVVRVPGWRRHGEFEVVENELGITADMVRTSLMANQEWILALVEASKLPKASFGLRAHFRQAAYAPDDPRSNLESRITDTGRVLEVEARRRWADGDRYGAVECLAAGARLATHLASQETADFVHVHAMLGMVRFATLVIVYTELAGPSGLSIEHRATLQRVLDAMSPDDPCGTRVAWSRRHRQAVAFVRSELAVGRLGPRLARELAEARQGRECATAAVGVMHRLMDGGALDGEPAGIGRRGAARVADALARCAALHPASLRLCLERAEALGREIEARWDDDDFPAWFEGRGASTGDDPSGLEVFVLVTLAAECRSAWSMTRECVHRARATIAAPTPPRDPE